MCIKDINSYDDEMRFLWCNAYIEATRIACNTHDKDAASASNEWDSEQVLSEAN